MAQSATVLVLGDSLSAAYGMTEDQGWVHILSQTLPQHEWINASASGETSGGGLRRLPNILDHHNPDVVFIELGGNDGLRGFPIKKLKANLEQMIQLSQQSGAQVMLSEVMIPGNYGPRYTSQFTNVYQELAEDYSITLVPFFMRDIAIDPNLMLPDGIHPNPDAQPKIAEFLRPWFESI
ncbi:arylesterase [Paraferrimonas sedimenticola]|uniref:Arylesterase n=2 Tax=Paraferrimonas sedimenticola TaxID=375674 RepID=A0AA37VSC9_9GAMM|nr:arylesterase [Paraferrimonas sedimenticola]GLP94824.1 arylesterase [Paraferrimonas sedimenticola]